MSERNEVSSEEMAKLAARVMGGYVPTEQEVRSLAASVLTQAKDHPVKQHAHG